MMDLPLEVIVEGTGNAIAGAVHAQSALKSGKHVVIVTKEVDIVVGPILRQMAKAEGLAYTAADGDQPNLLITLVEWARRIGLEVFEIPATLSLTTEGGLLEQRGVVEQVTYIRSANDNSMSEGVFLTVNADNAYSRQIIQRKGHISNKNGTSFLIFRPYHLCGVDTPYSILSVVTKKHFLADLKMKQYYDSFGRSRTSLLAGSIISDSHNSDFETFLAPATTETNPDASTPIPYHLTTGLRLKNDIAADTVLTHQMIDNLAESSLWQLRVQQNNKIGLIN